jgi:hypothetical protein
MCEPDPFDFNGDWIAHALHSDDYGIDMRFRIRNGALVSLSCGMNAPGCGDGYWWADKEDLSS